MFGPRNSYKLEKVFSLWIYNADNFISLRAFEIQIEITSHDLLLCSNWNINIFRITAQRQK